MDNSSKTKIVDVKALKVCDYYSNLPFVIVIRIKKTGFCYLFTKSSSSSSTEHLL